MYQRAWYVIANNGEYITEENGVVLYSLKKIIMKLINRNENCLWLNIID